MPSKSAAEELGAIPVDSYKEPDNAPQPALSVVTNGKPAAPQDAASALGAVPTDKWVDRGGPTTVQQAFPTTTGGTVSQISEAMGRPVDAVQDFIGRLQRGEPVGDSLHKAAEQLKAPGLKDKGITYEDILTKAQIEHGIHPELAAQSSKYLAPVMRVVSDPTNALMTVDAVKALRPIESGAEGIEAATKAAGAAGDLNFVQNRTLAATFNHNKRALKELATTRDLGDAADVLRSGDDPVVQFGSSVEKIRDRASAAASKTWDDVENIYRQADMKAGGKAIDGAEIAQNIRQRASGIEPVPQNQKVIESLNNEADYFEKKGPMSLGHAQDLKNNYVFKTTKPETHALGLDGNNQVRDAINESMFDSLSRQDPALAAGWKQKMSEYGVYAAASGAATDKALANISNRFISLTDYMAGGIGALSKPAGIPSGVMDAVATVANNQIRKRGASAAAVAAEKAGNILEASRIGDIPFKKIFRSPIVKYPGIVNEIIRNPDDYKETGSITLKDPAAIDEAASAIRGADLPSTDKAKLLHQLHVDGHLPIDIPKQMPEKAELTPARARTIKDIAASMRNAMQ